MIAPFVWGQGVFVNLNFERATIVPSSTFLPLVVATSTLPYWTAYIGSSPLDNIVYNDLTVGSPAVSIHDSASSFQQPLNGSYSVILQHSGVDPTSASIGQTGQVPATSLSLLFDCVNYQNVQVTFRGTPLPLMLLNTTPNYAVVGADISSFASQSGELRFTGLSLSPTALDDIRFSTIAVPEPSTFALVGIGGLVLILGALSRVPKAEKS